jgi:hypothetical protein
MRPTTIESASNSGKIAAVDNERRVLASIILGENQTLAEVRSEIGDDSGVFQYPPHATLYEIMLSIEAAGAFIEPGILVDRLTGKNLDGLDPVTFLAQVTDTVKTSANAKAYAHELLDRAAKRRMKPLLVGALRDCDNGVSHIEICEMLRNGMSDLTILPRRSSALTFDAISAAELDAQTFPAINWIVQDIIPDGLTILAGAPKVGKSWLAMRIAGAVAMGGAALGKIPVAKRGVWYLALEDNRRRLQSRQRELFPGVAMPDNLFFTNELPDSVNRRKSLESVSPFLEARPDIGLVIVDTLARVRPHGRREGYQADADALGWWHEIAHALGLAIVVIHHTRKLEAEDPLDSVSGTRGLTGVADTVVTLTRGRGEADGVLNVSGRDVPDQRLALRMEDQVGWTLLGDAAEYERTEARREIIDFLLRNGPATCQEIAVYRGKDRGQTYKTLSRMVDDGDISKDSDGRYGI